MNAPSPIPQPVRRARVRAALDAIAGELTALGEAVTGQSIPGATRDDLLMVLAEVMNNIVLHAYAGAEGGWIEIDVHRTRDGLTVETRDAGRPLPPALLEGGEAPPLGETMDDLPEGGFGWFIIHNLAQDMMYAREAGENRLTFSLPTA
ncbi:ATP-binding protein [Jannaschia sp. Os4]|uniref:ATP-binding protein n=1 Tax=Jannaschia sp. Os4 TaxID=2807617 RepID=UPI00193A2C26|nr:ATP-binding protein [Jannaschia sp. Os4]MBM2575913.1 ATP-binding protein [Jannaschia sp. Os4]